MDGPSPPRASDSPAMEELTPRSKVAKMLADIDNAPTPSPPQRMPGAECGERDKAGQLHRFMSPGIPSEPSINQAKAPFHPAFDSEDGDDDLDGPICRPQGRAARRMLGLQNGESDTEPAPKRLRSSPPRSLSPTADDEDLYSATPLKNARPSARSLSGSPLGSVRSGLFVSPAKPLDYTTDSEDELPADPIGSKQRLADLVAKKREERLRRETEEENQRRQTSKKRKHAFASNHASSDALPEGMLGSSQHEQNPEIERIMSDAARPTRKASKKALLEMERETQRLARQQALAHQMKVKKKFTTFDLFTRFNFRQPEAEPEPSKDVMAADSSASSAPNSDAPESASKEPISTPPSSPPTAGPTPLDKQKALVEIGALSKLVPVREDSITSLAQMLDDDAELPDVEDLIRSSQLPKKPDVVELRESVEEQTRRGLKLARLGKKAAVREHGDSSDDDDLEIIAPLPPHLRAFDKVRSYANAPADSKAIHALKHLSHIGAYEPTSHKPGKGASRPSIGPKALEAQLRRKAKEQARVQQQDRIAELKAKGIIVQSAEEREREQEVFENLLEKARLDAVVLRKAEKAAERKVEDDGAVNMSDDEDEEYAGSGSEEDRDDGEEEEGDEDEVDGDGLVDEAAAESDGEDGSDEDFEAEGTGSELEDEPIAEGSNVEGRMDVETPAPANRKPRQSRIVKDDEDSDADDALGHRRTASAPQDPEDDPFAAFNFAANGGSDDTLLSPTQAFQATMQTPTQATQDDSFDILRKIAPLSMTLLPPTMLPAGYDETQQEETQTTANDESQVPESQRINLAWETQPPETPTIGTLQRGSSGLSETPGWEPTQDGGLPSPWTIGLRRESTLDSIAEAHETQSTVVMRVSESPAVASTAPALRRGRLVRRQAAILADSSEDEDDSAIVEKQAKKDVFREMARKRKEALTAIERAEADKEMKEMLEEQAEESEDEYAGLGGDDFVAPETDADREMIDSSHVEVDERALAKLYAERERERQEEETSKLYKDLTTGALRRKQANAWGLEEDEDEIAMRRRQMRQREEARKRKLLLQDDNIAGLAQGKPSKGKDAFLKAIADDDADDMLDLSDAEEESEAVPETQEESQISQQQTPSTGPLREVSGNKRRVAADEEDAGDRPPAKQRRTQANPFRMPAGLQDVRESLSFLLEEPDRALVGPSIELDSDSENGEEQQDDDDDQDDDEDFAAAEEARQNDGGFAPNSNDLDAKAMPPPRLPASQRRTPAVQPRTAVVDRLSLKRDSSSTSSDSALGRSAWAAPALAGGFRAPSLLRRATTSNLSSASSGANDRGVTTSNGASLSRENSGSGVKMGGTKKSSLAYQARAEERRAIVEASARKREENTARVAQLRRTSSLLGKGLTGMFE